MENFVEETHDYLTRFSKTDPRDPPLPERLHPESPERLQGGRGGTGEGEHERESHVGAGACSGWGLTGGSPRSEGRRQAEAVLPRNVILAVFYFSFIPLVLIHQLIILENHK